MGYTWSAGAVKWLVDKVISGLAGKANVTHTHAKGEVGLGNVDNTADADKPISTAARNALEGKQEKCLKFAYAGVWNGGWERADASTLDGVRNYYYDIPLDGVTADMVPQVAFYPKDIEAYGLSPIAGTFDGGVRIYAETVPSENISVPVILCWR